MRCLLKSVKCNREINIVETYGDKLKDFDFEAVTKTVVKNDYESETHIDYCCIVVDDLEQLKLLIKAIREDVIIEYTDEQKGCDLVLKIYDDYLE